MKLKTDKQNCKREVCGIHRDGVSNIFGESQPNQIERIKWFFGLSKCKTNSNS